MVKSLSLVAMFVLLSSLLGCSGIGRGMFKVDYLGDTNKINDASTPDGFIVSPVDAKEIIQRHRGIRKTVDDYYADADFYYVCDGFNGSKPQTAIDYGIKINGQTGEVYNRKTESWLPDPRTDDPEIDPVDPITR